MSEEWSADLMVGYIIADDDVRRLLGTKSDEIHTMLEELCTTIGGCYGVSENMFSGEIYTVVIGPPLPASVCNFDLISLTEFSDLLPALRQIKIELVERGFDVAEPVAIALLSVG